MWRFRFVYRGEHILAFADPLEVGDLKTVNVVFTLTFGWVNRAHQDKIQKSARQWCPFYYVTTTFPSALPPNSCHSYSAYAVNDVQQPTFAIVCVRPQNIGRKWVNETQNNAVNVMCRLFKFSSHYWNVLLPFRSIYYTCLEPYRSLVMNRLMSTRIVPKMRRLCGETEVIWFFNVAYVRRVSPVLRWFRKIERCLLVVLCASPI